MVLNILLTATHTLPVNPAIFILHAYFKQLCSLKWKLSSAGRVKLLRRSALQIGTDTVSMRN